MKIYQAENGNTVIAQNAVQAAAFEKAGLKPIEGKATTRKQKTT